MRHFILITGASSGIGESAAYALAKEDYHVLAGVRKVEDGKRLTDSGGERIHPLIMDVTNEESLRKAYDEAITIIGRDALVAIVNNAGIAISGAVLYIPPKEWEHQFDVNVTGVIRTTQIFFHLLLKARTDGDLHPRRIINMSSVSGLFASPFLGPYVASKHALEALSDSLRRELYMHNIQVVLIEPGNIKSEIWEKAKNARLYFGPEHEAISSYRERMIDKQIEDSIPSTHVDAVILKAVRSRKVRLRYLVRKKKWQFILILLLPARWVDKLIRQKLQSRSGIRPF